MEKIISGNHEFELVDYVPYGSRIWNIGKNMIDGYLPLVYTGGYDGCQVNTQTMKAIKVDGAQTILAAMGHGDNTVEKMEKYISDFKDSKEEIKIAQIQKYKAALPIMKGIKGIEKLEG